MLPVDVHGPPRLSAAETGTIAVDGSHLHQRFACPPFPRVSMPSATRMSVFFLDTAVTHRSYCPPWQRCPEGSRHPPLDAPIAMTELFIHERARRLPGQVPPLQRLALDRRTGFAGAHANMNGKYFGMIQSRVSPRKTPLRAARECLRSTRGPNQLPLCVRRMHAPPP